MNNKKTTRRALFSSVMALLLCCSMLVGTTFAWFTDTVTSTGNIIKSGTLDVKLYYGDSMDTMTELTNETKKAIFDYKFWEPGFTQTKYIKIENAGDLAFKYQLHMLLPKDAPEDASKLAEVIDVYCAIAGEGFDASKRDILDSMTKLGTLKELMGNGNGVDDGILLPATDKGSANVANITGEIYTGEVTACIALQMQEEAGNDYQNLSVGKGFNIQIIAAQMTYEKDSFDELYDEGAAQPDKEYPTTVDQWDGTADTSWYNETDTEFVLTSAESLAGFRNLVDGGNTFAGKTVKLDTDVDLYVEDNGDPISFDPIGYGYDVVFKGTFDGQGHTISNLYQNGWALRYDYSTEAGGLFASVVDATIKDLTIDGAEIVMECIDMGTLVGYSYGNCTYENIKISNSTIANYQRYTGGVVGEVNGTQTFKNVDVDDSCTVSSLWGDFDASLGGIVGGKYGQAELTFEDCDVACVINAVNDVVSTYNWYAYRRAGMLIGNSEETKTEGGRTTATASYLTATNCTVTYGDWANYTYCRFSENATGTQASYPWVRVQAGNACGQCSAYSNVRYGVAVDANGNKVVDDNHVHGAGEEHNELIVFDQLFGGGQGVYGTAAHDGVTVIYNNK